MIKKSYSKIKKAYIKSSEYKGKEILSGEEGNNYIAQKIRKGNPFFVTRIGATELEVLSYYLYKGGNFDNYIKEKAHKHAGIFPETNNGLKEFSEVYLQSINLADCIGVWYNKNEGKVIKKQNSNCQLTELRALEPYYWDNPWSKCLSGKTVLVIHPFKDSIEEQYKRREKIFKGESLLPKFNLKVMKSIQSMKGNQNDFKAWVEALNYMKACIDKIDFDIAIIGAGAYGLPLGEHIKLIGKQAIHMGGSTQILFGVKGKRWDNHPVISKLYNDSWIRPNKSELYTGASKVEGGCYW